MDAETLRAAALQAEVERLREALKPFAGYAEVDLLRMSLDPIATIGHCRKAREALEGK